MDRARLLARLDHLTIETPSWGLADSGTRFGTFRQPWAAKLLPEKLADAGAVHRFTGVCPRVALHIPWDRSDDWNAVKSMAAREGLSIGSINPNVFQDPAYQFGSFGHRDAPVRKKAIAAHIDCIRIAEATGSPAISLWYADGTNYPGQDDFRARRRRFADCFAEVHAALPRHLRMFIEYKCFEPASYHTDVQDWGSALLFAERFDDRVQVLVDTGHHLHGTNIEQIVALLLDRGRLGGFHFNDRKYADDDLTVAAINPYQLFLILLEMVKGEDDADARVAACAKACAYAFDQCPNHKPTVESVIQSALRVQELYAKALYVDQAALRAAQSDADLVAAEEVLQDAYHTDVRPLLRAWRAQKGLPEHPLAAYRASGLREKAAAERGNRAATAGGGFP